MSNLALFVAGFLVTCIVGSALTMMIIVNNREFDRARAERAKPEQDKVSS
ncbi:MAG: hypothetical protein ACYTKC_08665 [Planctomycetota bacterium]|jgi:hypothetical protein